MQSATALAGAFREMAALSARMGSDLHRRLLERCAEDVAHGSGAVWELCSDWVGVAALEYLPIRVACGLHYLALSGRAPEYARFLPTTAGEQVEPWSDAAWEAASETLQRERAFLRPFVDRAQQTNEVSRGSCLLPSLLYVWARFGAKLPLALREIGSSAGLILRLDKYRYEYHGARTWTWGVPDAPVVIRPEWRAGDVPAAFAGTDAPHSRFRVVSRLGCDLAPVDVTSADARRLLQAYVWPDLTERFRTLNAALAAAAVDPAPVREQDACSFLRAELAAWHEAQGEAAAPRLTIVHHSYIWPYLSPGDRDDIQAQLHAAGAAATPERPLAWLRMEDGATPGIAELRVSLWPRLREGDDDVLLARGQAHGRWLEWLAEQW